MSDYSRYAIYLVPDEGALSRFGAEFLGWDIARGTNSTQMQMLELPRPITKITARPRKYGFHGTIKAPMRLAKGRDEAELVRVCHKLMATEEVFAVERLRLARLGSFIALVPATDTSKLEALARRVLEGLEPFRAPMTKAERARRNPDRLSDQQRHLLDRWGYPYVLEEFRFHMTLTGPLSHAEARLTEIALAPLLRPILAEPLKVASLCICGERSDGHFEVVERVPLGA
ncbi:MAG: DUF1045 domain-containing protein [Pseudomonadota bacterium]